VDISARAECIELAGGGQTAVVVAEGLRSWRGPGGEELLFSGPRLFAEAPALGRLRVVPDRLGVVDSCAETHAVVLAKNCRAEEMELTQRWAFDGADALVGEFEFIVPPAWGQLEKLGVALEFSGTRPLFGVSSDGSPVETAGGVMRFPASGFPAGPGIRRMKLTFIAKKTGICI